MTVSTEYRIQALARKAKVSVRNVRNYQDRGLLPPPRRRGRVAFYDDAHLARLRLIAQLLERNYTLASIKELVEAWQGGRSLGGVLGVVDQITGPWSDETPLKMTIVELNRLFAGANDLEALSEAVRFGLVVPDGDGDFVVPSPRELAAGAEIYAAGVPLANVLEELKFLRAEMEKIAERFVKVSGKHVFRKFFAERSSDKMPEIAELVRRLRPLAQKVVDVELARAMRAVATRYLESLLGGALASGRAHKRRRLRGR